MCISDSTASLRPESPVASLLDCSALLTAPSADWWLRAGHAPSVCVRLGLEYGEPSYYRDVYVWLPDVRWGVEGTPPCVDCLSAEEVSPHQFRDDYHCRRICSRSTHYFVISRRYICGTCAGKAKAAKRAAAEAAEAAGLRVDESGEEEEEAVEGVPS